MDVMYVYQYDDSTHSADDSIIDYWNPMDLMPYSLVNFVTFVVSTERKCYICDSIVLNKLTLTESKRISDDLVATFGFFSSYCC